MPTAHALATTAAGPSRALALRDWYPHRPSGPRALAPRPRAVVHSKRALPGSSLSSRAAQRRRRRARAWGRRRRASLRAVLVWLSQSVGGCGEGRGRQSPALVPRRIVRRVRVDRGGGAKSTPRAGAQGDGEGVEGSVCSGAAQARGRHPRGVGKARLMCRDRCHR